MFGSKARQSRTEDIRQCDAEVARCRRAVAAHRKETEDRIRDALSGMYPDKAWARGWAKQRKPNQNILEANLRDAEDAANEARRRWL